MAVVVSGLAIIFLLRIRSIIFPFLWAMLIAYLLTPVVNYVNRRLLVPRFWTVALLYFVFLSLVMVASHYAFPVFAAQVGYFEEDFGKLQGSLIDLVGPTPLGININALFLELATSLSGLTGNPHSAEKVLASAAATTIRVFIFLVSTFYLLLDGPRIRAALEGVIPLSHRSEIMRLARRINACWMQYIRGELLLLGIMACASLVGLLLLQVPGAVPLAVATGALELLPIVGPIIAGALAVSVAYLHGANPFGWNQVTYALAVAGMYFVLRETEDYLVVPKVLGRAVRLHPLAVLFALVSGGLIAGFFGLVVAVPIAASIKIVGAYLYDKMIGHEGQFLDIHQVSSDP